MAERKLDVVIAAQDSFSKPLTQAEKSFKDFTGKVETGSKGMGKSLDGLGGSIMGIRAAWLQAAGVVASAAWLVDASKQALESEKAMNRLRIQINSLGVDYDSLKGHVEDVIKASSRYALVQDDEVAAVLQQLIFLTGDYAGSVQNLNLVFDLAYQRSISQSQAATLIGKAMAGNIESLGELIPELRNLSKELGQNASQAEKTAKAMDLLKGKVSGAVNEMTEHERKVQEVTLAYNQLKEAIGNVGLEIAAMTVKNLKAPFEWFDSITGAIDKGAAWINPNAAGGKDNRRYPLSSYQPALPGKQLSTAGGGERGSKTSGDFESGDFIWTGSGLQAVQPSLSTGLTGFDLGMIGDSPASGLDTSLNIDSMTSSIRETFETLAEDERIAEAKAKLWSLSAPEEEGPDDEFSRAWFRYEQQLGAQEEYNTKRLSLLAQAGATEEELWQAQTEMEIGLAEKKRTFQLQTASSMFGANANLLQNLTVLTGKEGGKAFNLMKGFAIGETTIQTYRAAMGAYAALAPIPVVGPALAIAAATAATAAGMASVQQILATQPGGTSTAGQTISAEGMANPPYAGGSANAYPGPLRTEPADTRPKIVFNVEKIELLDESSVALLMERMSKLSKDYDVELVATRIAKQ
ncbi:MAG: hypothetical protein QY316_06355 [Thermodesulfobacteriota bacterium]|nr:MAG: hypothetical protein QY316_06355 [Thermodesulfobacteriota bacterium]